MPNQLFRDNQNHLSIVAYSTPNDASDKIHETGISSILM